MTVAERVVVSYPADLSRWGRGQLDTRHFRAWLKRRYPRPEPGDVWEEFLDVGCCGDSLDVPLRVERLAGGDELGDGTDIVYEEREACGLAGGWRVQSAAGPE
ncbi:hypothetical protein [Halosegnis marinus]|uniref:DUF7968 domain-containing protein n=1 Tax=Halosegnis marinus TaxID=3034023 RepID=A0ABD5ZQE8_9EURY|nr:hypothetical protein [Halosegnis sp. DT85]